MTLEIAIDVGGTFTDLVLRRGLDDIRAYKSPTTPGRIIDGVFNGLEQIATDLGMTRRALISSLTRFAFGTTAATNAILEGKAARTGLIVTRGFRETLLVREGGKSDTYNIRQPYPPPYVPRALTLEVDERINAEGGIERALDEESVRQAIANLRKAEVEAIAVSLLWSIVNPAHELRIEAIINEVWPGIPVSLGHRVNPCIREYRRTSAVALDASLKPLVAKRVDELQERLTEGGFTGTLTYVTSSGGQTSAADIVAKPVYLCFSGPAAAPEASRRFAELEGENGNIITVDMGGTSFDVSITTDWRVPLHREGTIAGHFFGVPSIEIHTIGAGGGSLARVDRGGFIHTGPESAGSQPGPACYGRGGRRATVTDANLALGLLDPERFADGRMRLDADAARHAIETDVAKPLGLSVQEAAALITLSSEQNMVGAISDLTVKRGIDPRDYLMVAGGAAAGLHAAAIAAELGITRVLVPRFAGVMSAFGILTGDVGFTFGRALFASTDRFDFEAINGVLAALEAEGNAYLDRMGFKERSGRTLELTAEARYAGQVWQLTLPIKGLRISDAAALGHVVETFHKLHEQHYSVRSPNDAVEITEWNLRAIGHLPDTVIAEIAGGIEPPQSRARRAWLRTAGGEIDVAVHAAAQMPIGKAITGPALVEDRLTTIVVPPNATAKRTRYGNILLELRQTQGQTTP
ncbi:MAG: hydantoinase/oxoprolinase family protein [Hyphomicrobiaceae bacterium]